MKNTILHTLNGYIYITYPLHTYAEQNTFSFLIVKYTKRDSKWEYKNTLQNLFQNYYPKRWHQAGNRTSHVSRCSGLYKNMHCILPISDASFQKKWMNQVKKRLSFHSYPTGQLSICGGLKLGLPQVIMQLLSWIYFGVERFCYTLQVTACLSHIVPPT